MFVPAHIVHPGIRWGSGKTEVKLLQLLGKILQEYLLGRILQLWLHLLTQFPVEGLNLVPSGCRLQSWLFLHQGWTPVQCHGPASVKVPADPAKKGISQEMTGRKGWQCWGCSQAQGQQGAARNSQEAEPEPELCPGTQNWMRRAGAEIRIPN